jgi:N-carbamoyl-L-amino-acid hydrolase
MLAYARAVLATREAAERHTSLATIGRVHVEPNGTNAIPSRVTAWLDARGPREPDVRAIVDDLAKTGVHPVEESWTPATTFDAALSRRVAALIGDAPVLPTGAGHDAGILATAGTPTTMLFVRNPTGVSHAPDEHADRADCQAGVEALTAVLTDLTA